MSRSNTHAGNCCGFAQIAACLAILSVPLWGCSKQSGAPGGAGAAGGAATPDAPVRVAVVEQKQVPIQRQTIGNVEAFATIDVKAQVSGELMEVGFKEGDEVAEGQVLFVIDRRPYEAELREREAELARAEALTQQARANRAENASRAEYARTQFERDKGLLEKGMVTQEEYDASLSQAEAAKASVSADEAGIASAGESVAMARAAIETAKLNLDHCTITSPIAGRTGALLIHKGNLVKANDDTLVNITQRKPIYVSFTLPEKYLSEIRNRMAAGPVEIEAMAAQGQATPSVGTLSMIDNTVDQRTGTIRIKATFENADEQLWPGQFVEVKVRLSLQDNAIVAPSRAVQSGQSGPFTYVLKPDSTVELRQVKTGVTVGTDVMIEEGLQPGETVVVEGQLRLSNGAKARVITDSATTPEPTK